jgi:hypothetical protein
VIGGDRYSRAVQWSEERNGNPDKTFQDQKTAARVGGRRLPELLGKIAKPSATWAFHLDGRRREIVVQIDGGFQLSNFFQPNILF